MNKRLLFIESDFAMGCMAQRAMRPHEVLVAPTLAAALRLLDTLRIDAVVFDPDDDAEGFDFLVRMATQFPTVRVIVYTMSREAERRLAFGTAHAIVRKPASDERLREAVLSAVDTGEYRSIRGR
jgi:DNA-binding NarL/FixJ family response regulator